MTSNLWNKKGVPHKNWVLNSHHDNGYGNYTTCEMCGNEGIRYVHTMTHINYKPLEVGCVCAENMCKNYNGKEAMKQFLKAQKKKNKNAKSQ